MENHGKMNVAIQCPSSSPEARQKIMKQGTVKVPFSFAHINPHRNRFSYRGFQNTIQHTV